MMTEIAIVSGERPTIPKQVIGLFAWILLCFLASFIGAFGSMNAPNFYTALSQPTWAPPTWLFGPVWSALYTMMAISVWMVWRRGGFHKQRIPLTLFLAQLALNALWSWVFFAWQSGGWALVNILALLGLIAWTIFRFWPVNKLAAGLLVPYILWVSFASFLNFTLWQLNPGIL